jgi:NADH pyrophosphatase NudC (nudix superfamily)
MNRQPFTCPRCGMTSHNPTDGRELYCGHCHWWTGDPHLSCPHGTPRLDPCVLCMVLPVVDRLRAAGFRVRICRSGGPKLRDTL